jgi:purine-nucleoside phosphorylase
MMLSDHINLLGASPLRGGPNFIDMSEVYSLRLKRLFHEAAKASQLTLHEGVYAAMPGPQFETPAEIRMLQAIGADAGGCPPFPKPSKRVPWAWKWRGFPASQTGQRAYRLQSSRIRM